MIEYSMFEILRENNYLPPMIFLQKSLFKIVFGQNLSTDFLFFLQQILGKLSAEFCKENVVPKVK